MGIRGAPIIVISTNPDEAHRIAGWLQAAGLSVIFTARTCDEAIFMLGRSLPGLLIVDEGISWRAEQRLLQHIQMVGSDHHPTLVRIAAQHSSAACGKGPPIASEIIRKPLLAHDVALRVGIAMRRPDLLGRLDQSRDQNAQHLEAARQMQIGLLPAPKDLSRLEELCEVGVASLYRPGEEIGGDLWGIWPTSRGSFDLAIADFTGHGLTAALNTFRLHALLSDQTLPRGDPVRMTSLLNARLHLLLPSGQYATMVYLHIDAVAGDVVWCGAGGPPPLLVSAERTNDLDSRGLPLGVRAGTTYERRWMRLPSAGILTVFSDGLLESGSRNQDVPREAMADALLEPARRAAAGDLLGAAREGTIRLEALRDRYPCPGHSDDVMAICVAIGPAPV